VGIVIGELYASNVGVGYLIAYYGSSFQTDKLFVGVMAITFMGITLDIALRRLEARFESWRPQR
jgi:NitT/TauT family transport system permease protein